MAAMKALTPLISCWMVCCTAYFHLGAICHAPFDAEGFTINKHAGTQSGTLQESPCCLSFGMRQQFGTFALLTLEIFDDIGRKVQRGEREYDHAEILQAR